MLPTLGGQTGLNLAMDLAHNGVLEKYGVEMIGAKCRVIAKAEETRTVQGRNDKSAWCLPRRNRQHARTRSRDPAGSRFALCRSPQLYDGREAVLRSHTIATSLIRLSNADLTNRRHEVLIEESIIGWKEYEMEVMRDMDDNVVIICSIENFDPMGVHTGDSITVAPAQTLTDKEYQRMRDASLAVIREIGVETGGSNIQFAIHPDNGRMIVIEMNPRVSRSSALASKATGFPLPRSPRKLAVGYRLWELPNDITRKTKACFEPTIDYVVTKIPRFALREIPRSRQNVDDSDEKRWRNDGHRSNFQRVFPKALRGLEVGSFGFGCDGKDLVGKTVRTAMTSVPSWRPNRRSALSICVCDSNAA